jgi:DHA2 family multidrug resistance protein-like MFS transporter
MARRVRPAWVMSGALVIAAAGFALLTQVEATSGLGLIVAGSVIFSIGVAPVVTLGTDMIVGAAPAEQAGAASAISETGTELGLALGVAITGSLGTAVYRGQLTDTVPGATPPDAVTETRETLGGAVEAAQRLPDPIGVELLDAARAAFTEALQLAAAASAVVAVGVAILAAVMLPRARTGAEPEPEPRPRAAARSSRS